MSTREPTDRPTGHGLRGHSEEGQTRGPRTNRSPLSPSPSKYSVDVSLPRSPWLDFHFRSPLKAPRAAPAVSAHRFAGHDASALPEGDRVVSLVPMSLGRSAGLIWKLVSPGNDIVLAVAAVVLIGLAWCVVFCWYLIWCIAVLPYRVITRPRRSQAERSSTT